MRPFRPALLPRGDIDPGPLLPLLGKANRAVARYDGIVQALVNPEILLSPLRAREAVLSSRIEGTQASVEDLFAFAADPEATPPERQSDVREVLCYREALDAAVRELADRPMSLNLIRRAHEVLLRGARGSDRRPGAFRDRQVHIGPPGSTASTATYLPPSATDLPQLLHNLETYFHEETEDLLIQVSIIHAQFELIHPFFDGNGRIGRMLVPLFLYARKAIATASFFISGFLEENREEYYRSLQRLSTHDDWQGWVRFFLSAIECQAVRDSSRAGEILRLYDEMKGVVADTLRSRHAIRVLDALFVEPVFTTPGFERAAGLPRNAGTLLRKLEGRGQLRVLRPGAKRRATIWMFPALLEIVRAPAPSGPGRAPGGAPPSARTLASMPEA